MRLFRYIRKARKLYLVLVMVTALGGTAGIAAFASGIGNKVGDTLAGANPFSHESTANPFGLNKNSDVAGQVKKAKSVLKHLDRGPRCAHNGYSGAACQVPKYSREAQFGEPWVDVDDDGCRTRDQVLASDMGDVTLRKDGCTVQSGTLHDGYSGKVIDFTRGPDTSAEVQIDHIVPLSLSWDLGANEWPQGKRVAFANDTSVELLAVNGADNQEKSDKGLAEWMPSTDYRCTYVMRFIHVLDTYDLHITPADAKAAKKVLHDCTVVYGEPFSTKALPKSDWTRAASL